MTPPPRIHWVSPLPPERTDIAHYTRRILPALAERSEIVLWTDAESWDGELERFAAVRRFDAAAAAPMDLTALPLRPDRSEAVFYHIGNSWQFHNAILRMARRAPGCVVIHDLAIQEMLRDLVHHGLMSYEAYRADMVFWHGAAGARDAERAFDPGPLAPDILAQRPMFQAALPRAAAALCHTRPGFEAVRALARLPAYLLDLPFSVGAPAAADRAAKGPLRLVQFGHIGPNRRLEQILDVLSGIAGEVDFILDVYGALWDFDLIGGRIAALGLADRVRLHGYVEEAALDAALRSAHLVFNLRFPTMGEASGSQLRIWNAAALSVVTDLGWYGALPDDCVLRVPLEGEAAALAALLRRLDRDRPWGASIAARGRLRLESHHTPDLYADGILAIARRYAGDARDALLLEAARDLLSGVAGTQEENLLARRRLGECIGEMDGACG